MFRGELAGKRVAKVVDGFAVFSAFVRRREEISSCTARILADKD
jgi:hypothetical protein